jgi:glycosyltransferase involved in cell wall biosynthesis
MARSVAQDWERIEHQLSATLGSIYNQTDPNFRIIIACTDKPDISVATDERLEFLVCEQLPAVDHTVFIADAVHKRFRIAQRLRQLGGGYLMFADADDLVSRKLVAYVHETAHPNGYSVARGYMFDAARGWLAPFPFADHERFDEESHTSAVLTVMADELPSDDGDTLNRFRNLMSDGHPAIRQHAEAENRPLLDIPFRAVVYVRNTGENVSTREAATTVQGRVAFQAHLDDELEAQRIERTPELDTEFNLKAAETPVSAARLTRRFRPLVGLAILIATHRRPQGLRRLLTALRPQVEGHPERSIVVVNDGSHDDAYSTVVEQFRDIITYHALARPEGIVVARNKTVGLCRAAYAVFTDDDCEPPPWWLDWLAARLRSHPEIDVIAGTTQPLWHRKDFRERLGELFLPRPSQVGKWVVLVTANAAIRVDLLRAVGCFGFPSFAGAGEDTELCIRLHRAGARFLFDRNWWVRHAVSASIVATAKRYRRYGEANASIGAFASVVMYTPPEVERSQFGKISSFLPLFRANLRGVRAFEGGALARTGAAAALSAVHWAYLRGLARPRKVAN